MSQITKILMKNSESPPQMDTSTSQSEKPVMNVPEKPVVGLQDSLAEEKKNVVKEDENDKKARIGILSKIDNLKEKFESGFISSNQAIGILSLFEEEGPEVKDHIYKVIGKMVTDQENKSEIIRKCGIKEEKVEKSGGKTGGISNNLGITGVMTGNYQENRNDGYLNPDLFSSQSQSQGYTGFNSTFQPHFQSQNNGYTMNMNMNINDTGINNQFYQQYQQNTSNNSFISSNFQNNGINPNIQSNFNPYLTHNDTQGLSGYPGYTPNP